MTGRLLACLLVLSTFAGTCLASEAQTLRFAVTRNGKPIGEHAVNVKRQGERVEVDVSIDLRVTLAYLPVFRYIHRNQEIWEGERLKSIETRTDDDGERHTVSGRAVGDRFQVRSSAGDLSLPGDILTTTYWNRKSLQRPQLLNTQAGDLAQVFVEAMGGDRVRIGADEVAAERYRISGSLNAEIWYANDDSWAKLRFATKDGSIIEYHRQ